MAVRTLRAVETLQWGASGNPLEVIPGEVCLFLADEDGLTRGYGYGAGWSMIFGSPQGDIVLEVGQWLTRLSDGSVIVEDERPFGAKLFDAKHFQDNVLPGIREAAKRRADDEARGLDEIIFSSPISGRIVELDSSGQSVSSR